MQKILFLLLFCLSANVTQAQKTSKNKRTTVKTETEATNTDFEILTKAVTSSGGCGTATNSPDFKCQNPIVHGYALYIKPKVEGIEILRINFGKNTATNDYKGVRPKDEILRFAFRPIPTPNPDGS